MNYFPAQMVHVAINFMIDNDKWYTLMHIEIDVL